ncbi:XRE family transcriptional regulator [Cereibacter changlensis JA139]|uniref:XRE family transcriptional regulator n=2 Tax=Cereibacter changlensis TaxID=402884 RepID=A0A2T4JNI7_9RHOB|nr:helix-turn-helix transcriptional regulator [Cereibacter changlensis]PTE19458.1 XRE family transcriptional regulator [Cereibacter changlensis JA139]PZX47620.1 DNA-binding XRE family transcriptional regulator [Cereibacter changlensis]
MKKVIPNGAAIKQLREQLERLSTQKEFANAVAVSVRMLRKIENENLPISLVLLDRIAKLFGVHRDALAATPLPPPAAGSSSDADRPPLFEDRDQIIPRHDWDYAQATSDEGKLYDEAANSHDLACVIEIPLTEETGGYAQELVDLLTGLTWFRRDLLLDIPPSDQIAIRRRIRQLMVMLRGNDIWIYQTKVYRRLPERYDLPPEDEPTTHQSRFVIALGPPGEYGETSMRVPIDHGQPFVLPSWKNLMAKREAT